MAAFLTPVLLPADPVGVMEAATRQYVDSKVGGGGGLVRSVQVISGATSAGSTAKTDYVYICTAALTLTLPTAVGNTCLYTVKNKIVGTISITTTASQTIDGALSFALDTQWMAIDLVSDGANWVIV